MTHRLYEVTWFERTGPHALRVGFDDGTCQEIDLEPILRGELFGPLRDPELFARVALDPEARTLVWPNGADLDPALLHDWPRHREAMRRLAESWAPEALGTPAPETSRAT